MNTTKHYKQIRNVFIVNVILSMFWLYWTFGRTYSTFANGYILPESPAILYSIVTGYCLTAFFLILIQTSFLCAQMKSLKNGNLFHPKGHIFMYIWAILWFFYDNCAANLSTAFYHEQFDVFVMDASAIGIPVIVITFALLYKYARQIAEENQLTI